MDALKELLAKHMANTINFEERKILRQKLSGINDSELAPVLMELWQEYHTDKPCPLRAEELMQRISFPVSPAKILWLHMVRWGAAIALFLLFCGTLLFLYQDNRHLNAFLQDEVNIHVDSGDKTQLTLPDGTEVFLNAATRITYPAHFGFKNRNIYLSGEAFLKVAKDTLSPFVVKTDYLQIEVLGTEFNVLASENRVETTLLKGSIRLTTLGDHPHTLILHPSQKAVYDKKNGRLSVDRADTHLETAWLRGELVFRSDDFAYIVSKLEQRYGVKIGIEDNRYDPVRFTGSFKECTVHDVLKILQIHYNFTVQPVTADSIQIRFR